jgi:hypothetical protein|tara:strand:+ start:72 stop:482 length:411 start_codon:yes stop_codon:yes gene_type:complete
MQRDENNKLLDLEWIFYIGRSAYLHDESNAWTVGLCRQIACREAGKGMVVIDQLALPKHWNYQKCRSRLETPIIEILDDTFDKFAVRFNKDEMKAKGCINTSTRTNDWWTDNGIEIQKIVLLRLGNFRVEEGIFLS